MPDIYAIAVSVTELAQPGIKPKDLIEAVRERHPAASKKQIVRGAFMAVITQVEAEPGKAARMHEAAISGVFDDSEPRSSGKGMKYNKKTPKSEK
ncbi:hypothetical protein [Aureimonas pseudogalii]|uniref:Putative iron-regulated membrane protein n=1 Tax=Aureimonas pseudogalii TaxID=1744844 RepID=A0A7W6MM54_9HYPH|nr:hypothetical protein [Aureimonas pseudogalii]MBB4000483.1 putative iron-regulated membrane protein [Aureimonas pseudogalii]